MTTFSLYHLAGGLKPTSIPGSSLRLRPLSSGDFSLFNSCCLEGTVRGVSPRVAVGLFGQCKQYGGAMSLYHEDDSLAGFVWLTQRDPFGEHFDISIKFLNASLSVPMMPAVMNYIIDGLRKLEYENFSLHTSTFDVHTADGLSLVGFEMEDTLDMHGACTWVKRVSGIEPPETEKKEEPLRNMMLDC